MRGYHPWFLVANIGTLTMMYSKLKSIHYSSMGNLHLLLKTRELEAIDCSIFEQKAKIRQFKNSSPVFYDTKSSSSDTSERDLL